MENTFSCTYSLSKSRAALCFWIIALAFAGLWLIMPSLLHTAYKADTIETQIIAKEWVWSTWKHPQLSAWLLEIGNMLTNKAFATPFILAALCTIGMLYAIWTLARNVLPENLALIGTFSMLPYLPLTFKSFWYNPNTVMMLCWNLSILTFYFAFQTNKKRWWIAAGLALGFGLQAKYSIILLAAALLLYSIYFNQFRKLWKTPGPWLTVLISFAVFLPHLIWFFGQGMQTIGYFEDSLDPDTVAGVRLDHLVCPLIMLLSNFGLVVLSPIILLFPVLGWRWSYRPPANETEKETLNYLFCCIAVPLFLLLCLSGAEKIVRPAYSFPLWYFFGVYCLLRFKRSENCVSFKRSMLLIGVSVLIFAAGFLVKVVGEPLYKGKPNHFHYPMYKIGAECDRLWDSRFDMPCRYIVSDNFLSSGFAAFTMRDRPTLHCFLGRRSLIGKTSDELAKRSGGLILWVTANEQEVTAPQWVQERFPEAEILPAPLKFPFDTAAKIPPLHIGVAVIAP